MAARQRTNFPTRVKKLAEARAEGRCEAVDPSGERCPLPAPRGARIFDHIIADALNGGPTLDNCQVLCLGCDLAKYSVDRRLIDQARRREERHAGTKAPSRPMPGSTFFRGSRGFDRVTRDRNTGKVLSRRGWIDVRDL